MQGKTLTDVFIEKCLINPMKCPNRLDGDDSFHYVLDGEEEPQNEEKSQA